MLLAITALGNSQNNFVAEILPSIHESKCNIVEIRCSRLAEATASYLLIQGNWNQIAKFETLLELVQKRFDIKIQIVRPNQKETGKDSVPYLLETMSLDRDNIMESLVSFLLERNIEIEEITGSSYQAPYVQSSVFSSKLVILIPFQLSISSLREEFLDFCDMLNIDAILEPIKR
jgi:glycine cleavage system transcriptional repressor